MARKKATKKKAAVAFPTFRELSGTRLGRYGACTEARAAFTNAFGYGRVRIREGAADGLDEVQLARIGMPSAWHILSDDGQRRFRAAYQNVRRGWDAFTSYTTKVRAYLNLLARYYIRYPRRLPRR